MDAPSCEAGTASRVVVQAAIEALERRGIDPAPVVRASGLTPAVLASVDARFPFENAPALWEAAAAATKDASFGLHVAEELPDGYGVLDYLLCIGGTLLQGYERLVRFVRIAYDQSDLRVVEEPPNLGLVRSVGCRPRQYAEFLFGLLLCRGRRATGVDWTPIRAAFMHPAPSDESALTAAFRCPLSFDARQTELVFDRAVGDLPLLKTDAPLLAVLTEYAQMLLRRLPERGDLVGRVRSAIVDEMPVRLPRAESVGRELKLPLRSLQRRLKEQKTSFARILDEIRHQLALSYLADASLSIGEITFLLHFSEAAAFDRAFKRWTRTTPSAYRAGLWAKPKQPK
jgi:AraC-like DNA-binding protein